MTADCCAPVIHLMGTRLRSSEPLWIENLLPMVRRNIAVQNDVRRKIVCFLHRFALLNVCFISRLALSICWSALGEWRGRCHDVDYDWLADNRKKTAWKLSGSHDITCLQESKTNRPRVSQKTQHKFSNVILYQRRFIMHGIRNYYKILPSKPKCIVFPNETVKVIKEINIVVDMRTWFNFYRSFERIEYFTFLFPNGAL